tara:strand:- start:9180 stop:9815 length:636 start_codon:yes stop_codon:yes gene_type:complete
MAIKSYAYYVEGNKLAIIEKDDSSANISTSEYGKYKSPISTVADGLEIKYTYIPEYRVTDASDTRSISGYTESGGKLQVTMTATASFALDDTLLITGSDRFNGIHKVNAATSNSTTVVLNTLYNGGTVTETSTLTYNVDAMEDESFEIDIPRYLQGALVYFLKAKIAEDSKDYKTKEYFMREFKKIMEKHSSSKHSGPRIAQGVWNLSTKL